MSLSVLIKYQKRTSPHSIQGKVVLMQHITWIALMKLQTLLQLRKCLTWIQEFWLLFLSRKSMKWMVLVVNILHVHNKRLKFMLSMFLFFIEDIDIAIAKALERSKVLGIKGKEITPFLLSEIGKITENQSLRTSILVWILSFLISYWMFLVKFLNVLDIALIKNNARIAAQISVHLSKNRRVVPHTINGHVFADSNIPVSDLFFYIINIWANDHVFEIFKIVIGEFQSVFDRCIAIFAR